MSSWLTLFTQQQPIGPNRLVGLDIYKKCSMANTVCPICFADSEKLFGKNDIAIVQCNLCGHRFAEYQVTREHVQSQYADDYFTDGKVGYSDYLAERNLLKTRGENYARLMSQYLSPRHMLDIGAAAGFVLEGFRNVGWSVEGVEPNASMASFARTTLGLTVHESSLEDYHSNREFDLVTAIQVMGHFADPIAAGNKLAGLTKTEGYCLIETWDYNSLSAKAFGRNWHEYSPPNVLHYFDDGSLRELMQRVGFELVERGRMLKWIDGEHAKSPLCPQSE